MLIGLFYLVVAFVFCYLFFVWWMTSRPREVFYHTFWSPVLARLTNHMQAITLWNWTILLVRPPAALTIQGKRHEDEHVAQYASEPYLFPFKYLLELARHGYSKNIYEQAARLAAGEPLR